MAEIRHSRSPDIQLPRPVQGQVGSPSGARGPCPCTPGREERRSPSAQWSDRPSPPFRIRLCRGAKPSSMGMGLHCSRCAGIHCVQLRQDERRNCFREATCRSAQPCAGVGLILENGGGSSVQPPRLDPFGPIPWAAELRTRHSAWTLSPAGDRSGKAFHGASTGSVQALSEGG